jgi:hypothetical protein
VARSRILELICVYDSHKTFVTRFNELFKKQSFSKPCALSLLTTRGDAPCSEWQSFVRTFPTAVHCRRINTAGHDLYYLIRNKTPCVIARCTHHHTVMLLTSNDLLACRGDIDLFRARLSRAIQQKFLQL